MTLFFHLKQHFQVDQVQYQLLCRKSLFTTRIIKMKFVNAFLAALAATSANAACGVDICDGGIEVRNFPCYLDCQKGPCFMNRCNDAFTSV